jgi:hypothetical protein
MKKCSTASLMPAKSSGVGDMTITTTGLTHHWAGSRPQRAVIVYDHLVLVGSLAPDALATSQTMDYERAKLSK